MLGSHRLLIRPAMAAAAFALAMAVAAPAGAAGQPHHHTRGIGPWHDHAAAWHTHRRGPYDHRDNAAFRHHGWHHHGGAHHLVHLPTLPILIEQEDRQAFSAARNRPRPAGIPDPVPNGLSGSRFAEAGGYAPEYYGGYGLPSWVPGSGTYAGNVEAFRDPGNGTYFAFYGDGDARRRASPPPAPKIIHVTPQLSEAACHMEAGVCVIRP